MVAGNDELAWIENLMLLIELRRGMVERRAIEASRRSREAATLIVFPGELTIEVEERSPIMAQRDRCWGDASAKDRDEGVSL